MPHPKAIHSENILESAYFNISDGGLKISLIEDNWTREALIFAERKPD